MDSLRDAGGDTLKMFGLELPLTTVALTSSCSLEERQNVEGKRAESEERLGSSTDR